MQHFNSHLNDEAGTLALGASLARALTPGLTIYLHGDLGAGKTTLTRALLHAAGYVGHVKSPTYTLAEPYSLTICGKPLQVIHFDLYRMGVRKSFWKPAFAKNSTSAMCASSNGRKRPKPCCRSLTSICFWKWQGLDVM